MRPETKNFQNQDYRQELADQSWPSKSATLFALKDHALQKAFSAAKAGAGARDHFYALVFNKLMAISKFLLSKEKADNQLQAEDLVNETYINLADLPMSRFDTLDHFLGFVFFQMKRILIMRARERCQIKRGGCVSWHLSMDDIDVFRLDPLDMDLQLTLDHALVKLERSNARRSYILEMKYFYGFDFEQIGNNLGLSTRTIKRECRQTKTWLKGEFRSISA